MQQASRVWAWSAPGFEDVGLKRARLQGFGARARQASRIGAWSVPGLEDLGMSVLGFAVFALGSKLCAQWFYPHLYSSSLLSHFDLELFKIFLVGVLLAIVLEALHNWISRCSQAGPQSELDVELQGWRGASGKRPSTPRSPRWRRSSPPPPTRTSSWRRRRVD